MTLNLKKTNFVIFRPYQKRLPFLPTIFINGRQTNTLTYLECKDHVKYLDVLIDYIPSWKNRTDSITLKLSKTIGLLIIVVHTLVSIYNYLVVPYLRYGLIAWEQASKTQLNKRALRFICFADRCDHAIPLFLRAKILPIHFLYYKLLAETRHDVNNDVIPSQLKDLFISLPQKFIHIIRDLQFPTPFILKKQNLKLNENRFQELVQNCGMRYQLSSEHYQNLSLKGKFV